MNFYKIYKEVYKNNNLLGVDRRSKKNPLFSGKGRKSSVAIAGGALGDEGKGRVTDELTSLFLQNHSRVIHYRDNGGANAGHTVEVGDTKIVLHQIGAGVLQEKCVVILGKGMVLHPEDLVAELEEVKKVTGGKIPAQIMIDNMAVLSLDTHRAFEAALKDRERGGRGSTGRGISPAYADIVYRHPVRVRDLVSLNWRKRFSKHFKLYSDLVTGLEQNIGSIPVPRLSGKEVVVGTREQFLERLQQARLLIKPYVSDLHSYLQDNWQGKTPFVFEKAQALGLDKRWGIYPDVTASDCTFEGIYSSTEGIVNPDDIAVRAVTIKATYTSSVGSRKMPTVAEESLARRIREDANEYGATTRRPRDIIHIDLPMLSYLARISKATHLVMTHLDISYRDTPIKVCVGYKKNGRSVTYRPDQEYLLGVEPEYVELAPWDRSMLCDVTQPRQLPNEALKYIAFISQALALDLFMVTVGPKREQSLFWF